jgi:hypothetical protein
MQLLGQRGSRLPADHVAQAGGQRIHSTPTNSG